MDTKERGVMEEKVYHPIKNETIHGNSFDYKSFDSKKDEQIQRNKGERSTRNIDNEKTTAVNLKKQKLVPESEYNDPTDEDDEHLFEKDHTLLCTSVCPGACADEEESAFRCDEEAVLVSFINSDEVRVRGIRGQGEVANGEPRHLLAIAQTWSSSEVGQSDREEGIILLDDIVIKSGCYRECVDWQTADFLGQGMFGKCHLAIDNTNSNVRFCCKKIKLERYNQTELTVWSNLTHPSIVRLYGAVRLRNEIYIFSELMEGGSLMNVIAGSPYGQLNSWLALQYFQQLLYVLVYLEEKRVIHEDLKTDNILVRAQNIRLAVADFGLACVLPDNQQRTPPDLSPVGGQAQYSPEKASSKGHDFGSDLWAAVCDFVEMLSGYAPWTQRFKQARLLHYVIYWKSPPIEDIPAGLPDDINNLIIRGWTVDSTQRPSASTLLQHRAFHLLKQNPADPMFIKHIVERDYVDIEAVSNTTVAEADANSAILDRTRHHQSLNTDLIEDMERLMGLPRDISRSMVTTSNITSMLSESLVATSNVTNMLAAGFSEEMCAASQVNEKRSESMNTVKTNKRDKERNVVQPPLPLDLDEMQNQLFQQLATPEPILDYEDMNF